MKDFGSKTTQLGLFDFRSFLNLGMLLTTSDKAKYVRARILDIVIATINEKTGGFPFSIAEIHFPSKPTRRPNSFWEIFWRLRSSLSNLTKDSVLIVVLKIS